MKDPYLRTYDNRDEPREGPGEFAVSDAGTFLMIIGVWRAADGRVHVLSMRHRPVKEFEFIDESFRPDALSPTVQALLNKEARACPSE